MGMRTMWAGVVRRWDRARAAWPHPLWAGFMRRTWRMKLTAAGTTTALAWGAWAVAEIKPAGGAQEVNTLLVGVLASLAALVVVLANILGKTVTQLSEFLPRKHPRNGEPQHAEAHGGAAVHGEVTPDDPAWRDEVLNQIRALRSTDEELKSDVKELNRSWAAGRASDMAENERKIEDHHNLAMRFLSHSVEDIETRLGNRVEKKVGECMDTLRAQVANVVKDAIAEAAGMARKAAEAAAKAALEAAAKAASEAGGDRG